MDDLISRQAAIAAFDCMDELIIGGSANAQNVTNYINKVIGKIKALPSAQSKNEERMEKSAQNVPNDDFISRKGAIDAIEAVFPVDPMKSEYAQGIACGAALSKTYIEQLPSAQPEPLSDAYMKAVLTWLLDYQIKASELEGRYTPYEVLSWVANDWRKEHERFDQQTGGD